MNTPIVSPKWLKENIDNPNLVLLDASQQTNVLGIASDLAQLQIPEARNVDLNSDFSLKDTSLPNMLPTPEQFEEACKNLGINKSSKIVVYDNLGVYTSPRVWWITELDGQRLCYRAKTRKLLHNW